MWPASSSKLLLADSLEGSVVASAPPNFLFTPAQPSTYCEVLPSFFSRLFVWQGRFSQVTSALCLGSRITPIKDGPVLTVCALPRSAVIRSEQSAEIGVVERQRFGRALVKIGQGRKWKSFQSKSHFCRKRIRPALQGLQQAGCCLVREDRDQ